MLAPSPSKTGSKPITQWSTTYLSTRYASLRKLQRDGKQFDADLLSAVTAEFERRGMTLPLLKSERPLSLASDKTMLGKYTTLRLRLHRGWSTNETADRELLATYETEVLRRGIVIPPMKSK